MSPTLTATVRYEGSAANTGKSTPNTWLIHPPFLVERNTEGHRNDEISRTPDAFKDDLGWKFCSIRSNGKCDSEALLFCSAGFYWNRSAVTELQ